MADGNGIKLGLQVNQFTFPGGESTIGPELAALGRRAEEAGFASLWVMDHFFQIGVIGPPDDPMLECYAALSYVAGVTRRLKLGSMVTGVTYRHPGVLIKTVTTLDVLSGGRAYLGIGAAWNEQEHVGLGIPFPPLTERFERLEETLQIAHLMWSGEVRPFEGTYYRLAEPINRPVPLSKPHPPILIGGGGEQKTLRFVAKYGDACNLFGRDLDMVRHKLDVLRAHCEAEGRSSDEIEKTTLSGLPRVTRDGRDGTVTPAQAVEWLGRLAELGIEQHLIGNGNVPRPADFELLSTEVVPQLERLIPAGRG